MQRFFRIYNSPSPSNNFLTLQNAREDIIGELDAIIQYEKHLVETEDMSAKRAISDIVKEEKLHVGQLMGLLFKLDPESKSQFDKGMKEFLEEDNN